jgi:hypothetical protein
MLSDCTAEVERTRLAVREDTLLLMDAAKPGDAVKPGDEGTEEQTVRMAAVRYDVVVFKYQDHETLMLFHRFVRTGDLLRLV